MKFYIDEEFKCHTTNPDGIYREVEADVFDGKCSEFIEGHRYYPPGFVSACEKLEPWKPYSELEFAQREYERQKMKEYEEALKVVGVTV